MSVLLPIVLGLMVPGQAKTGDSDAQVPEIVERFFDALPGGGGWHFAPDQGPSSKQGFPALIDKQSGPQTRPARPSEAPVEQSRAQDMVRRWVTIDGDYGGMRPYTALVGWYPNTRQLLGLTFFSNGDSVIIRGSVKPGIVADEFIAEGEVTGRFDEKPVLGRIRLVVGKGKECHLAVIPQGGLPVGFYGESQKGGGTTGRVTIPPQ